MSGIPTHRSAAPAPLAVNPARLKHVAISASAGSGKTYQLTNRYLQLIAAGAPPESILASTFTRLAAGEIRDRILLRLVEAIHDDHKREALRVELGARTLSRESLLSILTGLVRRIDRVASGVRTLDSFFAAVVKAFAIELRVPLGAQVVDEHQALQMRSEAIRLMLDERQPQELIDLLRLLTMGSSQRGVTQVIDRTINDLYSLYSECDDAAWECVAEVLEERARARWRRLAEDELNEAVARCADFVPPKGWAKAHAASIESAWRRDWSTFIAKGVPSKIIAGESTFSRTPISAAARAVYEPLIDHARMVLVERVRDQTRAARELLQSYHVHYEAVKRRRHAVTFDDLVIAMSSAPQLGTMEAIGFRLDARLHHLLLDEFQDTSVAQWRALAPLAHEIVSYAPPQRTFFCVGDVKQSIYGWRDAAPEVLDELPNLLIGADGASAIEQRALAKSYRSSPIVIDVVNRVFETVHDNEALAEFAPACAAWSAGFQTHDTNKRDAPGYVELRTTADARTPAEPAAKGLSHGASSKPLAPGAAGGLSPSQRDPKALRYALAADIAADVHRRHPHLSIAILTRTNSAVAAMLFELGPDRRAVAGGVSGRGGGPLTDAPAVNAILDLLQLADHPDDTIAAFHVANSPLGEVVGLRAFDDRAQRQRLAREVRRRLLYEGYATTIAAWVSAIMPHANPHEQRRLMKLVDLALLHDEQKTLRPRDFIGVVEDTPVARVQPAAVQVMTIHQSKGLEFDVVILPELHGRIVGSHPPVVFERAGGAGRITKICRFIGQETLALVADDHGHSPLSAMHEQQRMRTARETLSVLYVAMTRAKHALHMIIDPPAANERTIPKTMTGVLRCVLSPDAAPPNSVLFAHGDPEWFTKVALSADATTAVAASTEMPIEPIQLAKAERSVRLGVAARSASGLAEAQGDSLRHALTLSNLEARDHGTAWHALFEQIEWIDHFALSDEALAAVVRARLPRRGERWIQARVCQFRAALAAPALIEALSPCRHNAASTQLHREYRFARLVDGEHGGVQTGAIDRLVVQRDDAGRACAATICDFKTDALDASDPAAPMRAAEHYRVQMETYRDAVAEVFNLPPANIAVQLIFIQSASVVTLEARSRVVT